MNLTMRRICSGVTGFGGSLPAGRVARGGVKGRCDIVEVGICRRSEQSVEIAVFGAIEFASKIDGGARPQRIN